MEARIILTYRNDGVTEVSTYDPHSGRHHRTGLTAKTQSEIDKTVRQLKEQFERAGNRVTVVERRGV
jgi:hypothetical protein